MKGVLSIDGQLITKIDDDTEIGASHFLWWGARWRLVTFAMLLVFAALVAEGVALSIRSTKSHDLEAVSLFFFVSVWCIQLIVWMIAEDGKTGAFPLVLVLNCFSLFLLGAQANIERQMESTGMVFLFIGATSICIGAEQLLGLAEESHNKTLKDYSSVSAVEDA